MDIRVYFAFWPRTGVNHRPWEKVLSNRFREFEQIFRVYFFVLRGKNGGQALSLF